MQATYVKRTRKFFNFSQALLEMKDNDHVSVRKANWTILFQEIKNFGVSLDPDKQQKLIDGNDKQVKALIDRLFEIDSIPASKSTRSEQVTDSRLSIAVGEVSKNKSSVTRQSEMNSIQRSVVNSREEAKIPLHLSPSVKEVSLNTRL